MILLVIILRLRRQNCRMRDHLGYQTIIIIILTGRIILRGNLGGELLLKLPGLYHHLSHLGLSFLRF